MADVEAQPAEPAPALPDYVLDPDAVLKDSGIKWRYGRPPDYSKTRAVFAESELGMRVSDLRFVVFISAQISTHEAWLWFGVRSDRSMPVSFLLSVQPC